MNKIRELVDCGSKIRGRAEPARSEIHHKLEGVPHQLREKTGCPIL